MSDRAGEHKTTIKNHTNGVPLGGIGTGAMEYGPDAIPRNITINNNRTVVTRIPVSPNAFTAIRVSTPSKSYTRILQPGTEIPFEEAGVSPAFFLYPSPRDRHSVVESTAVRACCSPTTRWKEFRQ